ncbi:CDP-alcohol phosphatidyltransferase family protein [Candidatus Sumerlaeota bacterium]|nr:CDP-alcohol phosphatidyltransferase family protein [Candidatus Sumerlaeota bacterium]
MTQETFAGDRKAPMKSPLARVERRFIDASVHRFPPWLKTQHLTMMTVLWCLGLILSGWLAGRHSLHWLWLSSLMLFLQWFTDAFDGSLGKARGAGLVKWGYYMDHLLDYLFVCCIIISYMFIVDGASRYWLILTLPVLSAMWVSAFLSFNITNQFQITQLGVGPTEFRLLFIALNTAIIFCGKNFFIIGLPLLFGAALIALLLIMKKTSDQIWRIDMEAKNKARNPERVTPQGD